MSICMASRSSSRRPGSVDEADEFVSHTPGVELVPLPPFFTVAEHTINAILMHPFSSYEDVRLKGP